MRNRVHDEEVPRVAPSTSRRRLPKGFREGHDGTLACPHRDLSCCAECARAHPQISDGRGVHYWIPCPSCGKGPLAIVRMTASAALYRCGGCGHEFKVS